MTILPTPSPSTGTTPKSYQHFWAWFQKNEQSFIDAMTDMQDFKRIEEKFLDKLSPKLDKLHKGIFPLVGKLDSTTAELTLTVNGVVKNIALVEELVDAAPVLAGWKFTALKPATLGVMQMEGCSFSVSNMAFYVNQDANYPDTIAITVAHNDYDNHPDPVMYTGVSIFLDNYLGELVFATTIDELTVIDTKAAQKPLIPISNLRNYLTWRQQVINDMYMGTKYNANSATITAFGGKQANGQPLTALIDTNLLNWNAKASHPWVLVIAVPFNGTNLKQKLQSFNRLAAELATKLPASAGCISIGRKTTTDSHTLYLACQDFRKPSQVVRQLQKSYAGYLAITYELYKDKSWQTFEEFATSGNPLSHFDSGS
jgi:hypothetical protein